MKITINESMFRDHFRYCGRADQFSYNALTTLYNYLEDAYPEPKEYDLDVIGLCCEFSEYANATDAVQCYDYEHDDDLSEDEQEQKAYEFLCDNTTVIKFEGGILIAEF
jgi:hypothetical protein